jgi:hypothetical protein
VALEVGDLIRLRLYHPSCVSSDGGGKGEE